MPKRGVSRADLDERILQAEARAAQACRNHDGIAEWEAECDLQPLYEERAGLIPEPREAK